ncbi:hypothetical protein C1704_05605 [Caldimonas caldifontis]|uniref:Uncharacterized protein n=1 Tax=Caldimonas caldifontis TaxID=1452508 RepID=A0A2S5SVZ8_9BURK|nr:hypothetical protein C1704_05605 [Caldimonas caldifontis]
MCASARAFRHNAGCAPQQCGASFIPSDLFRRGAQRAPPGRKPGVLSPGWRRCRRNPPTRGLRPAPPVQAPAP